MLLMLIKRQLLVRPALHDLSMAAVVTAMLPQQVHTFVHVRITHPTGG